MLTPAIKGGIKPNKTNVYKPPTLVVKFREEGNRYEKHILRQDQILKDPSQQKLQCDNWLHIFGVSLFLKKGREECKEIGSKP